MTVPRRMMTSSLINRKRRGLFLKLAKDGLDKTVSRQQKKILLSSKEMIPFVLDSISYAMGWEKRNADKNGRAYDILLIAGDLVLFSTVILHTHVVTNVGRYKLLPKYIGSSKHAQIHRPFFVLHRPTNSYNIELPQRMRTHPKFYVGRLRPYCQNETSSDDEDSPHIRESPLNLSARVPHFHSVRAVKRPLHLSERFLCELSPVCQRRNGFRTRPKDVRGRNRHDPSSDQHQNPCEASAQNRSE